jgi:hypothetical protein
MTPDFGWQLPPGAAGRDAEGAEERDEDGLTRRERIEIEKGERAADLEREGC